MTCVKLGFGGPNPPASLGPCCCQRWHPSATQAQNQSKVSPLSLTQAQTQALASPQVFLFSDQSTGFPHTLSSPLPMAARSSEHSSCAVISLSFSPTIGSAQSAPGSPTSRQVTWSLAVHAHAVGSLCKPVCSPTAVHLPKRFVGH